MLPLFLDLRGRRVIVFGGGRVALRKARYLCREASVTVVSRELVDGFDDIDVTVVKGEATDHLDMVEDADIVVAATGDTDMNDRIAERSDGRPFNRDDGVGTFLIPSTVERGGMTIAISTHGRCPALTREMRLRIDGSMGEELESMLTAATELREELRSSVPTQEGRENMLRAAVSDDGVWGSASEGPAAALEAMREVVRRC